MTAVTATVVRIARCRASGSTCRCAVGFHMGPGLRGPLPAPLPSQEGPFPFACGFPLEPPPDHADVRHSSQPPRATSVAGNPPAIAPPVKDGVACGSLQATLDERTADRGIVEERKSGEKVTLKPLKKRLTAKPRCFANAQALDTLEGSFFRF